MIVLVLVRACARVCARVRACARVCARVRVCVRTRVRTRVRACVYARVRVCMRDVFAIYDDKFDPADNASTRTHVRENTHTALTHTRRSCNARS